MSIKYSYVKEAVLEKLTAEIQNSALITIALDYINSDSDNTLDIFFKAELSQDEITALNVIVTAHIPTPISEITTVEVNTNKSALGNIILEQGIYTGKEGTRGMSLVTPDMSDRTTWYQKSAQVSNETLTDSGNGLTFTSAHTYWVDIYSPKLTYTHKQIPKRDGTYGKHADWATVLKVDGVTVTSGFTINYAAGTVTFSESQATKTVTCTYWHTDGITQPSEWLLVPPASKKYVVEHTELQFSVGTAIADTLRFEIWAGANLATYGSFPDYLFEAGYGQFRADYRNANDLVNAANLGQGSVPIFGGLTKEVIVIPFNYLQAFTLDSAVGAIFRLCLLTDTPFTGCDIATGTFYVQLTS